MRAGLPRRFVTSAALALAATMLGGCGEPATVAGPASKIVNLRIEGTSQPMRMQRYRASERFPLGFVTYVPEDMRVEEVSSGEEEAVHITAAFAGRAHPEAAMAILVFPTDVGAAAARERVRDLALELGDGEVGEAASDGWAEARYRFGGEYLGFAALGAHAGRRFYVQVGYPPEYADGMGPRVDAILDEWRWTDTGRPLRGD